MIWSNSDFMLECNVKHDIEGNPLFQHRIPAWRSSQGTASSLLILHLLLHQGFTFMLAPSSPSREGCAFMLAPSSPRLCLHAGTKLTKLYILFISTDQCFFPYISCLAVLISVFFLRYHVYRCILNIPSILVYVPAWRNNLWSTMQM